MQEWGVFVMDRPGFPVAGWCAVDSNFVLCTILYYEEWGNGHFSKVDTFSFILFEV